MYDSGEGCGKEIPSLRIVRHEACCDAESMISHLPDLRPDYEVMNGLRDSMWVGGVAVRIAWSDMKNVVTHPAFMDQIGYSLEGREYRHDVKNNELRITFQLASTTEGGQVRLFAAALARTLGQRAYRWGVFESVSSKDRNIYETEVMPLHRNE